jgi:fructose 1,6-bisphosphatase
MKIVKLLFGYIILLLLTYLIKSSLFDIFNIPLYSIFQDRFNIIRLLIDFSTFGIILLIVFYLLKKVFKFTK